MHDTTTPQSQLMKIPCANFQRIWGFNDWKSTVSSLLRIQAFKWFLIIELQLKCVTFQ